jgi:hypothetical protein
MGKRVGGPKSYGSSGTLVLSVLYSLYELPPLNRKDKYDMSFSLGVKNI